MMTTATGLHRLEQYRKKIESTVQAVSTVLTTPNLPSRALAMAQKQWAQVDQLMDNHIQVLDIMAELLGDTDQQIVGLQPSTNQIIAMVEVVRQELMVSTCA
jgi:predicted urease superfamily metal-dependent hydrolase